MAHICFVTNEIHPITKGGIGVLLSNLIHALLEDAETNISVLYLGPELKDLSPLREGYKNKEHLQFYALDCLLSKSVVYKEIPLWAFHFEEYHTSYKVCNALLELNNSNPIDVIEFNDYLGIGYVTNKFKKLIYNSPLDQVRIGVRLHGSAELCQIADEDNRFTKRKQVIYHMERYALANADFWISPSTSLAGYYARFYGISKKHYVSIPPFTKCGPGQSHTRKPHSGTPKILFYGKLQRLKGIEEFIKAGVNLLEKTGKSFQFEIFGHEVNYPHLKSYSASLHKLIPERYQSHFHFRGRISIERLEKIASDCDLAVVPSRFETFCLAAHELNWIGVPLVLNRIDAFKDYFTEDTCWYTDSQNTLSAVLLDIFSQSTISSKRWNGKEILSQIEKQSPIQLYTEIAQHTAPPVAAQTETPLVSVVVPYYNMEKYINDTLDSILNSTYRACEIIVVNDGSPGKKAIAKFNSLAKEYPHANFSFIAKENGGLGSARNYGIARAKGKYILPLDSDDVIHRQYIELAVRALEKNADLVAVNSFVNFFMDGKSPDEAIDYVIPYDLVQELILVENRAGVACSIFRADLFKKISYNEELKAYEDWELWWKISHMNLQVETLPVILYHYRRRPDSMVNQEGIQRHMLNLNHMSAINTPFLSKMSLSTFNLLSTLQHDYFHENIRLREQRNTPGHLHVEGNQTEAEQKFTFMKEWYNKEYEVLPLWYKRVGHVIKVVQGHRPLKSLFKKDKS